MAGISFGSINTGLPPNIVDQLMEAEKIPIKSMQKQKEKSESKLKLVDELTTKISDIRKGLSELAGTKGFTDIKLISGDPNVITGTVDPNNYQAGNWSIEVLQMPLKASAVTNGFPDKDKAEIGVGYFRFQTSKGEKDVYLKKGSNTLEKAAKVINQSNVGVRATVIADHKDADNPYRMVFAADGVGKEKNVQLPTIYMLDGDQDIFIDKKVDAKNGQVKVDGIEFEVDDTLLKDIIPGASVEIKQANPGHAINVQVKEDQEVVSGKVKLFVDGMNSVLAFVQAQNKVDKATDTSKTLGGDGLLRTVEQRLRGMIQTPMYGMKGSIKTLSQLGIVFNRAGTLDFDQKKFNSSLASDPAGTQEFLIGDGFSTGFIPSVRREVTNLLNPSFGPVTNRSNGLKEIIKQSDERIAQKESQLEKKEVTLREKFSRLEETMSKLKAQGAQLGAASSQLQQG